MEIPPMKQTIRAKEYRQMEQIIHGSGSQPYLDYLSMKIELEEAAAQLETLRELGNAIRLHRRLLGKRVVIPSGM
jgi:hypothetical protein